MTEAGKVVAIIGFLVFVCVMICFCGCESREEARMRVDQENQNETLFFVKHLKYVKDTRTGICYAYEWNFRYTPVFATVSCEKIPPELLIIVDPEAK